MAQEIKTQWLGNMLFNADTLGGNFKIDAAPESGGEGKGVRPKALMLTSLAGCTGMDIVSLLKKMRAEHALRRRAVGWWAVQWSRGA